MYIIVCVQVFILDKYLESKDKKGTHGFPTNAPVLDSPPTTSARPSLSHTAFQTQPGSARVLLQSQGHHGICHCRIWINCCTPFPEDSTAFHPFIRDHLRLY